MGVRARVLLNLLCFPVLLAGQSSYFLGAVGGISTLSADGRSLTAGASTRISLYKPANGPTFQVVGGRHLSDLLSLQFSYGWNRNRLTLTSSQHSDNDFVFYEQMRKASQHSLLGELLLYFRSRRSFARPYLSVGAGVVHLDSSRESIKPASGQLTAPGAFSSTDPAFRVAVGIDLFLRDSWAFRFIFAETIRKNAISAHLTPPGERNLAHFQNLFGFVKYF